jgi:hypothetical protein
LVKEHVWDLALEAKTSYSLSVFRLVEGASWAHATEKRWKNGGKEPFFDKVTKSPIMH